MMWFWILLLLRIGQALGFAFTDIGPVAIGSVATVSWKLNETDAPFQICTLGLGNGGIWQLKIGDFALKNGYYTFNLSSTLPPGCVPVGFQFIIGTG